MIRKMHLLRRHSPAVTLAVLAGLAALILAPASRAQESTVQIDPAQTKIEFSLGGNFHTVHGTFALKSSAIHFDPSTGKMDGAIVVDATSGETGNGGRDARMHREILESAKFPEIVFTPLHMTGAVAGEGVSKVEISGRFRLLGQDHGVTLPFDIKAAGGNLQITTHIEIPYVQWGLKNPSNFFLRVSDKVGIEIQTAGRIQSGDSSYR
jgi:polyisoprenoid-binding protein YceI